MKHPDVFLTHLKGLLLRRFGEDRRGIEITIYREDIPPLSTGHSNYSFKTNSSLSKFVCGGSQSLMPTKLT